MIVVGFIRARAIHTESGDFPLLSANWVLIQTLVKKTVFSVVPPIAVECASLILQPVQSGYPKDDDASVG